MNAFAQKTLRLFEAIHPLDRVPRAGFLLRGVPDPESVAAHSHFLSLLALIVAEEYPDRYDLGRLLSMAIVHDLSEARIMDIPMPYADAYLDEAKHRAEQAIAEDLFLGFSPRLPALHREFHETETPEAKLLRGLDKVQMMLKILYYEREHRGYLEEFWHNPKNFNDFGLEEVAMLFDAICAQAGRKRPCPKEDN